MADARTGGSPDETSSPDALIVDEIRSALAAHAQSKVDTAGIRSAIRSAIREHRELLDELEW